MSERRNHDQQRSSRMPRAARLAMEAAYQAAYSRTGMSRRTFLRTSATLAVGIPLLAAGGYAFLENREFARRKELVDSTDLGVLATQAGLRLGTRIIPAEIDNLQTDGVHAQMIRQAAPHFAVIDGQLFYKQNGDNFNTHDPAKYAQADKIANYARAQGIPLELHHLVWGKEANFPDELKGKNFSPDELRAIIQARVADVTTQYPDAARISVVNEILNPMGEPVGQRRNFFAEQLGVEETLAVAFTTARQHAPQATLMLNDWGNEDPSSGRPNSERAQDFYELVASARAQGIPIDAVGMQMHLNHRTGIDADAVAAHMQSFAQLGVSVHITELDVDMAGYAGADPFDRQAEIFGDVMAAVVKSRGACQDVAFFGIDNSYLNPTSDGSLPIKLPANDHIWTPSYTDMKWAIVEEAGL